jgi:hypothetical protein
VAALALVAACGGRREPPPDPVLGAVQIVGDGLADPSEWVRAEAARLAGQVPERVAQDDYRALLQDPSALVRSAALEAFIRAGSSAGNDLALRALLTGTPGVRIQLLELVVRTGNDSLRRDALLQALRDGSPDVRAAAIARLAPARVSVARDQIDRLLADTDRSVVDATIRHLAAADPHAASEAVLSRLRSNSADIRAEGMRLATSLAIPALWPQLRSLARTGAPEQRTLALFALGQLGDPSVEGDLRGIILNGTALDAARALEAVSYIDTPTAREQPLRQRRDSRVAVRRAAFHAMARLEAPVPEFESFFADPDPELLRLAMVEVQRRDPERAARLVVRAIAEAADPASLMVALERAATEADLTALLRGATSLLAQVAGASNQDAAYTATRLLLRIESVADVSARLAQPPEPAALYALLESTLTRPDPSFSALYAEGAEHELFLVRFAASAGIAALGAAFAPPSDRAGGS